MAGKSKKKAPVKIINLFGDAGRYAGRVMRGAEHEVHFWKYYFDDYMSVDPTGSLCDVNREKLAETVGEIYSGKYDAASCDSNDALLLQYFAVKKGCPPLPFLINEVDRFEMANWVRKFIARSYGEDYFDDFVRARANHWMHITAGRNGFYTELGIKSSNLYYLPMCGPSIEFTFPDFFKDTSPTGGEELKKMRGKIIAPGTHNRDFAALAEAMRGTGLEVHIITNLRINKPVKTPELVWHDSLPQAEYMRALRDARLVVVPLRDDARAAGQMACAIPMRLGTVVVAAEGDSLGAHIVDGETGFTYKPGSAESLKLAVLRAYKNSAGESSIGENAKKKEAELSEIARRNIKRFLRKITKK